MDRLRKISIIALTTIFLSFAISTIATASDPYDYPYLGTEEAGAFFGLSMAVCGIFMLVWFVIWILVAIWVYRDAEKRGSSGILWLIIVILLGLIGIIIWLVVRPPIGGKPKEGASGRMCPNCGRPIPMDARVCPYCGKEFEK